MNDAIGIVVAGAWMISGFIAFSLASISALIGLFIRESRVHAIILACLLVSASLIGATIPWFHFRQETVLLLNFLTFLGGSFALLRMKPFKLFRPFNYLPIFFGAVFFATYLALNLA